MENRPKKLLDQVRETIRRKHYSSSTEESYVHWIKRQAGGVALAWRPYVSLRLGTTSKSQPDLSPLWSLNQPAAATPTALSVQSFGGG